MDGKKDGLDKTKPHPRHDLDAEDRAAGDGGSRFNKLDVQTWEMLELWFTRSALDRYEFKKEQSATR